MDSSILFPGRVEDEAAAESLRQFVSMWRVIIRDRDDPEAIDCPGLAIRWADSPLSFWNMVFLTDPRIDHTALGGLLDTAAVYLLNRRRHGYVCVTEECLDATARSDLTRLAERSGLVRGLTVYGMVGDFLPVADPIHPPLRFVRATDEALLRDLADVNARAYGQPLELWREGLAGSLLWKRDAQSWVAFEDGVPVSGAAALPHDDHLYVDLVSTVPEAQCRGYGAAAVLKALAAAGRATGLRRAILHSTEAGLPVYWRLGFRRVATMHLLTLAD